MNIKITPLNIEKANTVKGISKNISEVLDFQVSVASEINRIIADLNKVIPLFNKPGFDDKELKRKIAIVEKAVKNIDVKYNDTEIKKEISAVKKSISNYDDSAIKKEILSVSNKIDNLKQYDDSGLTEKLEAVLAQNELLTTELDKLKKSTALNQAEIRSNRNAVGQQIDILEQKFNKITEVK